MFKFLSTLFLRSGAAVTNLVVTILLANSLGLEAKGMQSLIVTYVLFISLFSGILGSASVTYLLPLKKTLNYLLIPLPLIICVPAFFYLLSTVFFLDVKLYVLHITLLSVINSISTLFSSISVAKNKLTFFHLQFALQPLLLLSLLLFVRAYGVLSIDNYILSLYFSYILTLSFNLIPFFQLIRENYIFNSKELFQDFKEMLKYGSLSQIGSLTQIFSSRGTYFIVNELLSKSALGLFSVALAVSESVWLITKSKSAIFYSKAINTKSQTLKRKFFIENLSEILLLQGAAIILMLVIPESLYLQIFGVQYLQIKTYLLFFAPGIFAYGVTYLGICYFMSCGKHVYHTYIAIIGTVVLLALTYSFTAKWGLVGASMAISLGYIFQCIIALLFYWFGREAKV